MNNEYGHIYQILKKTKKSTGITIFSKKKCNKNKKIMYLC